MSEFVNYNKRDVNLPPGCKDLADVLRRKREMGGVSTASKMPLGTWQTVTDTLAQAHKYIGMVFASDARSFVLVITSEGERLTVTFTKSFGKPVESSVTFPPGFDEAVRSFFARNQLQVPEPTGIPAHFYPDIPWQTLYHIAPLPPEPSQVAELILRLFREVHKLRDEEQVRFHWERTARMAKT